MATDCDDPTGLVGEELNTVAFVMDYVEFSFNGPVLRALSNPIVDAAGVRLQFPEPGSRDALCLLIGSEVGAVTVRDGDRIELALNNEHSLTIPLDPGSRRGAEAAHFVPARRDGSLRVADMMIW
jgi:hypothetical protein